MNVKGKEEIEKVGEGEVEDIYRDKEKVSQFQFSDRLLQLPHLWSDFWRTTSSCQLCSSYKFLGFSNS